MDMRRSTVATGAFAMVLLAAASAAPALAHHAMDGTTPETVLHGFISGLAHPVIGLDHLAFILVAGVVSALAPGGLAIAGTFVVASLVGVLLHVAELGLPMVEPAVAASVLAVGLILASGLRPGCAGWMAIMLVAGLLHGYAFGESIVGARTQVIGAYLVGITIIAFAIAAATRWGVRALTASGAMGPGRIRLSGIAASAVGVVLLAVALAGA